MTWLWREVVEPAFAGIRLAVDVAWALIQVALGAFEIFIRAVVAPAVTWLWQNMVRPAFDGIAAVITTVWNNGIRPVLATLGSFIRTTLRR